LVAGILALAGPLASWGASDASPAATPGEPVVLAAAGTGHTTGPTPTTATPQLPASQFPSAAAAATICRAYQATLRAGSPQITFAGSTRLAPIAFDGQVRIAGAAVAAAVRGQRAYLKAMTQDLPPADRTLLAPYLSADSAVMALIGRDKDNLGRVNADARLRRYEPAVVAPSAAAGALLHQLLNLCG